MTVASDIYDCANDSKAKFESIYNAPDPRGYYTTLRRLDYQIPTNAKPIFKQIIELLEAPGTTNIVDVGCSYGVNAAMLKYDLTFEELAERYMDADMQAKSVAETIIADKNTFCAMPKKVDASFVGLDVAEEAAGYADTVGLLENAVVENLETTPLSPTGAKALKNTDLIITTGAVGYVGADTFSSIMDAAKSEPPWVAAFVLRQFPFESIADTLANYGLATERLPDATFVQRRFRDEAEQEGAIEAVRAAGRDPEGFETEGYFHAELYLARPKSEITAPIGELGLV